GAEIEDRRACGSDRAGARLARETPMHRSQASILAGAIAAALVLGAMAATPSTVADAKGRLHVPTGYQKAYEYLGSWSVAGDSGAGAKEMHTVYASPGATAAFRRTGHFPDGTVLVKEVREAATASMTTGTVSHPTALKGWFVAVRDSKNTHPGNPL